MNLLQCATKILHEMTGVSDFSKYICDVAILEITTLQCLNQDKLFSLEPLKESQDRSV